MAVLLIYLFCIPFSMYSTTMLFVEGSQEFKRNYSRYRKDEYWFHYRAAVTWAHILVSLILSLIPIVNFIMMLIGCVCFAIDLFNYLNTLHVYKRIDLDKR